MLDRLVTKMATFGLYQSDMSNMFYTNLESMNHTDFKHSVASIFQQVMLTNISYKIFARNSKEAPLCQYCKKSHWGQCRLHSNLCYAYGGSDHYIRECLQNAKQASTRPLVHLSATPISKNKGPRQAQSVIQGRGKGSHSNAQTHQKSRAPARMYHLRGREDEESSNFIASTVELNYLFGYYQG
ncbi:hypothetical protein GQ457_11G031250 [Hibiscus cannabinus]